MVMCKLARGGRAYCLSSDISSLKSRGFYIVSEHRCKLASSCGVDETLTILLENVRGLVLSFSNAAEIAGWGDVRRCCNDSGGESRDF